MPIGSATARASLGSVKPRAWITFSAGTENQWNDIIWQYLALSDPGQAVAKFGSGNYTPEEGATKAFTYHWLHNLIFIDAPSWVFTLCYTVFGLLVLGTLILAPPHRPRFMMREEADATAGGRRRQTA